MSKAAYYFTLLFVFVATGTISSLPGAFGSFARLAAVPAICLTLLSIYLRGSYRRLHTYHWAFFIFILWNIASYFWSVSPVLTLQGLYRYAPLVVSSLVIWENSRTRERAEGMLQAFVCGGYLIVLTLLYNYVSGNASSTDPDRLKAGGFNPDDFLYLIPVPVAWYLARRAKPKSKIVVLFNLGYVLVAPLGIIFTATRASLLVALPGYLYILWSGRKAPASWKIGVAVAAIVLVGLTSQLDVSSKLARLGTLFQSSDSSTGADSNMNGRGLLWELAFKEFSHNPLTGIGCDAFPYVSLNDPVVGVMHQGGVGLPVHNTYISVLTETGIIGFLLLACVIGVVVWSARRLKERELRHAFIAALVMMAVGVSSVSYEQFAGIWLLCIVIIANTCESSMIRTNASDPTRSGFFGRLEPSKSISKLPISEVSR